MVSEEGRAIAVAWGGDQLAAAFLEMTQQSAPLTSFALAAAAGDLRRLKFS
jgi:hypothetical protein